MPTGTNKQLTCLLTDGTVETKTIDEANTSGTTIAVTGAFSSTPLAQGIYSISSDDVKEQKFRCLSVGDSGDGTFAVVGVEFNDSIYAAVEEGKDLDLQGITTLESKPPKPII